MYDELKKLVCDANCQLQKQKLVVYSWGNVSGIDRRAGIVAIKPSGVAYDDLTPDKIVVLDLGGNIVDGDLRPSSDTPTHLELYRNFETIGGICHTHSPAATAWAQAHKSIPCLGTTHADYFYGPVPVTEPVTNEEIKTDYEMNAGRVIVRRFASLDPLQVPAVLVADHGPFTWGKTAAEAVEASVILEQVAEMALNTIIIDPDHSEIPKSLLDRHFLRKHGKDAYYGQE